MTFCECGHYFTDHYQTDVEYLCLLCGLCDGYTKAAANISATAPVPAGGTPEGLARKKVEMTDSEVKPSSPTTEAERLHERLCRIYEEARTIKDMRELQELAGAIDAIEQQAREGGYRSGLLEGRREAVRRIRDIVDRRVFAEANRDTFHSILDTVEGEVAGLNASVRDTLLEFGQWLANAPTRINMLRASFDEDGDPDEFVWLVDRFLDVAGLEGEGRSPIGSNASESPPLCDQIVNNGFGEPTECGRTLPCPFHRWPFGNASEPPPTLPPEVLNAEVEWVGDASESGQPPEASDE